MAIFQDLITWRFWRHFITWSFACLVAFSTILQTSNVLFPNITSFQGMPTLITVVVISILAGLFWSWPQPISQEYSLPKTKISIVKGNLLHEKHHLVIGICDTFDTETPVIISKSSLQGQALDFLFGGDVQELDRLLAAALAGKPVVGNISKNGKQAKYGVGTIATVKHAARLIFFSAYCEMNQNNVAGSNPDQVWKSLQTLWLEVSNRSNGTAVSIPVIGGGQARLSSLIPAQDSIRLIVLSFMFASRINKVCDELRIIISPADYKKLDRLELQSFLSSLRSS